MSWNSTVKLSVYVHMYMLSSWNIEYQQTPINITISAIENVQHLVTTHHQKPLTLNEMLGIP